MFNIIKRFKFVEQNKILAISTILDPRFKKAAFESPVYCSQALHKINSHFLSNNDEFSSLTASQDSNDSSQEGSSDFWQTHDDSVRLCEFMKIMNVIV